MKRSMSAAIYSPHSLRSWLAKAILIGLAPLALSMLGGCAADVTRSTNPSLTQPQFADHKSEAGNVEIALTPEAQKELQDNLKFNQDTLLDTVRRRVDGK